MQRDIAGACGPCNECGDGVAVCCTCEYEDQFAGDYDLFNPYDFVAISLTLMLCVYSVAHMYVSSVCIFPSVCVYIVTIAFSICLCIHHVKVCILIAFFGVGFSCLLRWIWVQCPANIL